MISTSVMAPPCEIVFEGQKSWIGKYGEVPNEGDLKSSLTEKCKQCFRSLYPSDQIIILEPSKTLHERCFTRWAQAPAQKESGSAIAVEKASFLGYSILFPLNTRKFAIKGAMFQNEINAVLKRFLDEIARCDPQEWEKLFLDSFEQREIKAVGQLLQETLQDFLNAYGGELPEEEFNPAASKLCLDMQQFVKEGVLTADRISNLFKTEADLAGFGQFCLQNKRALKKRLEECLQIEKLCSYNTGLELDKDAYHRALSYLQAVLELVVKDEFYAAVAARLDERFFRQNYEAILELSSHQSGSIDAAVVATHLNRLENSDLKRLLRLSHYSTAETTLIQSCAKETIQKNQRIDQVKFVVKLIFLAASIGFAQQSMGECTIF